jgi:hypothetical protein
MHLPRPLALGDFLAQVGQRHIGTVAINQRLLAVAARSSALVASD